MDHVESYRLRRSFVHYKDNIAETEKKNIMKDVTISDDEALPENWHSLP